MAKTLTAAVLFALLCTGTAAGKGKKHVHPSGFSLELPEGWTAENGPAGAMLVPRGVKVDPNREDNSEVYTVYPSNTGSPVADESFVANLRDSLQAQGAKIEANGVREAFGRSGEIHTFDFMHPERKAAFRVRVFRIQAKGRRITLVASGLREKLQGRDKTLREIAASLNYDR